MKRDVFDTSLFGTPDYVGLAREFTVAAGTSVKRLLELAVDSEVDHAPDAEPAGVAAVAAIQLAKLAQSLPAVLAAQANHESTAIFDPPLVTIKASAVQHYRKDIARSIKVVGEASIPLSIGPQTRFVAFCDALGENSVAIIVGDPDLTKPVRVRLHSACLTGDVFGSRRCDCGDQLKLSLARLGETGGGIILYLAQEGRGLGLGNKLRTYQLQEAGLDTVDANAALGFDDDERDYGVAARMLEMLGIQRVVLLTKETTSSPSTSSVTAGPPVRMTSMSAVFNPRIPSRSESRGSMQVTIAILGCGCPPSVGSYPFANCSLALSA
jgi:GTP cyclohydrolase II